MASDPRIDPRQPVVDRVLAFWPEIVVAARAHELEPAVLAGLVCQESAGKPSARRYEPKYRWLYGDGQGEHPNIPADVTLSDDLIIQKWSYGLCQIMGAVAREYGYAGYLKGLLDPAVNLEYGARHLANKIKQAHGSVSFGLLLYNGGGDKQYPDKVLAWAALFQTTRS